MMTFQDLKIILLGQLSFILIDLVWLGFIMRDFYIKHLGHKMRMMGNSIAPHWPSAIIVWFLLVLGIYIFVLPRIEHLFWFYAFGYGALYGFIVYGIYNLTNYAMFTDWPFIVVMADVSWGVVINGIVTCILWYLNK